MGSRCFPFPNQGVDGTLPRPETIAGYKGFVIQLKWCILTYGPLTETRKSELVLFFICYKTGIMGVCQCKQLVFGNKINRMCHNESRRGHKTMNQTEQ